MPLLSLRNLVKVYPADAGVFASSKSARARGSNKDVRAVNNVSLDIEAGETMGLVGESGCGKSTLGRMILRLIPATAGTVTFNGEDVLAARSTTLRRLRRDMQIIFQDPFASLNPRMRVEEIITEPLVIHGLTPHSGGNPATDAVHANENFSASPPSKPKLHQAATEMMRAVGLDESALRRYPHEFSGGQRQRIGIARALILRPKFVVCDEPVSALDVSVGAQIVNLLKELQRTFGLTYLFISHSMPVVRYLCDRIAVMRQGEIVELGSAEQVTAQPRHEYTRTLLAATPEPEYRPV